MCRTVQRGVFGTVWDATLWSGSPTYTDGAYSSIYTGGGGTGGFRAALLWFDLSFIPAGAPVFSAWGMLMSDLRRDYFVTELMDADDHEALAALLDRTRERAFADFAKEQVPADKVKTTVFVRARYQNQEFGVEVPLPEGRPDPSAMARMVADFHNAYEREYTYDLDVPIEFVGAHVVATADVEKLQPAPLPASGRTLADARKGRRPVDYATEGVHDADVYVGELLEPGMRLDGPAIIESRGTTVVVHPGDEVVVDDYGNVVIGVARADESEGSP